MARGERRGLALTHSCLRCLFPYAPRSTPHTHPGATSWTRNRRSTRMPSSRSWTTQRHCCARSPCPRPPRTRLSPPSSDGAATAPLLPSCGLLSRVTVGGRARPGRAEGRGASSREGGALGRRVRAEKDQQKRVTFLRAQWTLIACTERSRRAKIAPFVELWSRRRSRTNSHRRGMGGCRRQPLRPSLAHRACPRDLLFLPPLLQRSIRSWRVYLSKRRSGTTCARHPPRKPWRSRSRLGAPEVALGSSTQRCEQ